MEVVILVVLVIIAAAAAAAVLVLLLVFLVLVIVVVLRRETWSSGNALCLNPGKRDGGAIEQAFVFLVLHSKCFLFLLFLGLSELI